MKMDLALNNLKWSICHKTKPKQNGIYEGYSIHPGIFLKKQNNIFEHYFL